MLRKIENKLLKKNKSKIYLTPGEAVRDEIIAAGIRTAQESGYAAGNTTEKLVNMATKVGTTIDRGSELGGGTEAAAALGRIGFRASKDIARGDTLCTGFCLVSGTCEFVAVCCSTVKFIPYRGKIYVGAKVISRGCMAFRNACAGEGC